VAEVKRLWLLVETAGVGAFGRLGGLRQNKLGERGSFKYRRCLGQRRRQMQFRPPPSSSIAASPKVWAGVGSQPSCIWRRQRLQPNHSLKRTRAGMPFQALTSFWAFHVMPARAA